MVLCEIREANKSIRITQLTVESLFIFVVSKIIRQTAILVSHIAAGKKPPNLLPFP